MEGQDQHLLRCGEPSGGEPQQHRLESTAVQLGHDYNLMMRTAWIDNHESIDNTENGTNLTEVHWWSQNRHVTMYVFAGINLQMMTQMGRIEPSSRGADQVTKNRRAMGSGEQQPLAGPFMNRLWTSWPYSSNMQQPLMNSNQVP